MKVVWRVVYIIYATVLLLIVGNLSLRYRVQLYFENEGQQALNSSNEMEKFYFFYGSIGYHQRGVPPIIVENEEFVLAFFEVYRMEEGYNTFYIMLYPQYEGFKPDDRVRYELAFNFGDNQRKVYDFDQFQNMQMYVLVNSNRHALITVNEIQKLSPTSITVLKTYAVVDEVNQKILTQTDEYPFLYNIQDTDLKVGKNVENGMAELGITSENLKDKSRLLDDYLINCEIYPKHYHNAKKYSYVFYLSVAATLIAIVLGAYFLFFFRRGNKAALGSGRPTKTFRDFGYKEREYKDPLLVEDDNKDS
jgi:hypothetical protein